MFLFMSFGLMFRIINHYPNHFELTRKDLMVKNIKRYIKVQISQTVSLSSRQNYNLHLLTLICRIWRKTG